MKKQTVPFGGSQSGVQASIIRLMSLVRPKAIASLPEELPFPKPGGGGSGITIWSPAGSVRPSGLPRTYAYVLTPSPKPMGSDSMYRPTPGS
jgi:hypothetical protein